MVSLGAHNYIDNFYTLADADNNYLAKAGYYLSAVHPNYVGNDAVYDTVETHIDDYYSLTQQVVELISDNPCPDSTLLIDENGIAQRDELGEWQFGA